MSSQIQKFSGADAKLGFDYQVYYALYMFLEHESTDDAILFIEKFDDIVIQSDGRINIDQLKYKNGDIVDRSNDFWGTVRIWSELIYANIVNITHNPTFMLITTQKISENSFINKFKDIEMDSEHIITAIRRQMQEISKETTNEKNAPSYKSFQKLSEEQQSFLIANIKIKEVLEDIDEIKNKIKNRWRDYLTQDVERDNAFYSVYGWWQDKCMTELQKEIDKMQGIKNSDLRNFVKYAIEQANTQKTLPINLEIINKQHNINDYENHQFVKSLKEVNIGENTLENTISDWYKAYYHRAEWVRKQKVLLAEEEQDYENKLINKWKTPFGAMLDKLNRNSTIDKADEGYKLCEKFIIEPNFQIYLKNTQEDFIMKGSYHILVDGGRIGWHCNFKTNNPNDNIT